MLIRVTTFINTVGVLIIPTLNSNNIVILILIITTLNSNNIVILILIISTLNSLEL
jgi:hypothetical protein